MEQDLRGDAVKTLEKFGLTVINPGSILGICFQLKSSSSLHLSVLFNQNVCERNVLVFNFEVFRSEFRKVLQVQLKTFEDPAKYFFVAIFSSNGYLTCSKVSIYWEQSFFVEKSSLHIHKQKEEGLVSSFRDGKMQLILVMVKDCVLFGS